MPRIAANGGGIIAGCVIAESGFMCAVLAVEKTTWVV
jgi:hypothetical protein